MAFHGAAPKSLPGGQELPVKMSHPVRVMLTRRAFLVKNNTKGNKNPAF
jgi:hypothetical protein